MIKKPSLIRHNTPTTRLGYTMVELLIVLAIVTLLAAIIIGFMGRTRGAAYRANCEVQVKSIALALDAYRQEQGHFPLDLIELETANYIPKHDLMHCPADPDPEGTYDRFYVIRGRNDDSNLPLLVCPFHENYNRGVQAYVGRYTTQLMTKPAKLIAANATTIKRPAKKPVAAPAGLELRGADILTTAKNGSATILFADGSTATLKRNSTITLLQSFLDRNTQPTLYTLLKQTAGDISYVVNHGSKFEVTTPAATAGALGTKFSIEVEGNFDTTLKVTDGEVRFVTERRRTKIKKGKSAKAKNRNPRAHI